MTGWICDQWGARTAMVIAGSAPVLACIVIAVFIARSGESRHSTEVIADTPCGTS